MKLVIEAKGIEVDVWLRDYIRTTVIFALWHHDLEIETVRVHLALASGAAGESYVCCGIRAELSYLGAVEAGATGHDACTALREAADLLEVALLRPPPNPLGAIPDRLAA